MLAVVTEFSRKCPISSPCPAVSTLAQTLSLHAPCLSHFLAALLPPASPLSYQTYILLPNWASSHGLGPEFKNLLMPMTVQASPHSSPNCTSYHFPKTHFPFQSARLSYCHLNHATLVHPSEPLLSTASLSCHPLRLSCTFPNSTQPATPAQVPRPP